MGNKGERLMHKITVTYDEATAPNYTYQYADELQAHQEFAKYIDWGFADEYSTVNLYTPTGKCYTKVFYRKDRKVVTK
jgi:hypothetical protein